jgi:8-oxo-dGTP diphosphatase
MPTAIAIAVVEQDGQFLIGRREVGVALAGLWEFPGGKVEANESPEAAAIRECLEETGVLVTVVGQYERVEYRYAHGNVDLHFFACRPVEPGQTLSARFRWVKAAELPKYEFPAANADLVKRLAAGGE